MDGHWRDLDVDAGMARAFRGPGEAAFPGRAVLVIEDDSILAEALATALRTAGFRAIQAGGAGRALGAFRQAMPDLVLLDLAVGEETALGVIRELRSLSPTPVVVLAAREPQAVVAAALAEGACACVKKPFGVEALLAPLRAALAA